MSVKTKTNAARLLDRLGIRYEIRTYPPDQQDLSPARLEAALGVEHARSWKTLVARGDRTGPLFAVIPIAAKLDLKALAAVSGDKRVELLPLKEVLAHTGYVRGAVTALAAKRKYATFVDAGALALDAFGVSAGAMGVELWLAPEDYVRAVEGTVESIVDEDESTSTDG